MNRFRSIGLGLILMTAFFCLISIFSIHAKAEDSDSSTEEKTVTVVIKVEDGASGNSLSSNSQIQWAMMDLPIEGDFRDAALTAGEFQLDLKVNHRYVICQTKAAENYDVADEIAFTINDAEKILLENATDEAQTTNDIAYVGADGFLHIKNWWKLNFQTSAYSGAYDGNAHGIEINVSKPYGTAVKRYGLAENSCTLETSPTFKDAGNYTVYYQISAEGYKTVTGSETISISQRPITFSWGTTTFTYDGRPHLPTATAVGLVAGDSCGVTTGYEQTGAGEYTAWVTAISNPNYVFYTYGELGTTASASWKIEPAENKVSVSVDSITYGESPAPKVIADFGADMASFTYSNQANGTYSPAVPVNPGTWYVQATIPQSTNYQGAVSTPVAFEIRKAVNHVKVSILGWTYGQTANQPVCSADYGENLATFQYSDKVNGIYTSIAPTNVGTWDVKAIVPETDNYLRGESDPVSFEIRQSGQNGNQSSSSDAVGYYFSVGQNAALGRSANDNYRFVVNRSVDDSKTYSHFQNLQVDGMVVDPVYYTVSPGSLVGIIKASYMNWLFDGSHTLRVIFDDGIAETSFTLATSSSNSQADASSSTPQQAESYNANSYNTNSYSQDSTYVPQWNYNNSSTSQGQSPNRQYSQTEESFGWVEYSDTSSLAPEAVTPATTGDGNHPLVWVALLVMAVSMMGAVLYRKRITD